MSFRAVIFVLKKIMLRNSSDGLHKALAKEGKKSERLREERVQIKLIDFRPERWQVVRFRKAIRRQDVA